MLQKIMSQKMCKIANLLGITWLYNMVTSDL